jgi:2-keto-4-pentenoate hydratase
MKRAMTMLLISAALLAVGCNGARRHEMVETLVEAREEEERMPLLTETYGDFSIEEAYAVQHAMTDELVAEGATVTGYKVGYASRASQKAWNISEPAYGPLMEEMQVVQGGEIDLDDFHAFHIEVEVAVMIDRRIDKPLTSVEELRPFVRSVHPAFDIPDNRFEQGAERTVVDIIADGVGAHRYVLGPGVAPQDVDVNDITGIVRHNGKVVYRGKSSNVMGGPYQVVLWLANTLIRQGKALEAGQVVITGALDKAYSGPEEKVVGRYVGDCGKLGKVTVKVKD